jgi:hypothetical protein
MSTLQVANLHLESTGNNRIQYEGSNNFTFVAAGVNAASANSSGFFIDSLRVGKNDNVAGDLRIYGSSQGDGGELYIFCGGTNDSTVNYYLMEARKDLKFKRADGTFGFEQDTLIYDANEDAWDFVKPVKFSDAIREEVYALSGTSVSLSPTNGVIQTHTLTGSTTYTDSFNAGESMTLLIDDGSAYTVTWPTITWVNNAGVAPTLATSGYTVVAIWKIGSTLYGALVGDGS